MPTVDFNKASVGNAVSFLLKNGFEDPTDLKVNHGTHYKIVKDKTLNKNVLEVTMHDNDGSNWDKEPDDKQRHEVVQQSIKTSTGTGYTAAFWMMFGNDIKPNGRFYHVTQLKTHSGNKRNPANLSLKDDNLVITFGASSDDEDPIILFKRVVGEWNYYVLQGLPDRISSKVTVYDMNGKVRVKKEFKMAGKAVGTTRVQFGIYRRVTSGMGKKDTIYYADVFMAAEYVEVKFPGSVSNDSKPDSTDSNPDSNPDSTDSNPNTQIIPGQLPQPEEPVSQPEEPVSQPDAPDPVSQNTPKPKNYILIFSVIIGILLLSSLIVFLIYKFAK